MEFIFLQIKAHTIPRTTGPISTKFGTKHPWVDGIHIFTNKGPHPSSRGDNNKIIKIYGEYFKIFYFRSTGPISTKLGIKHPWIQEIQILFSNKESCPSTRGDNS